MPDPSVELETPRLTLRPLPPAAAALLPRGRAAAAELIGAELDRDWPQPDLLDILPRQAAPGAGAAYGVWTVVERATRTVVGDAGFHGPPDERGVVEIGYSVVPSRRRRGYAGEAVASLVAWARTQPGVTSVVAGTVPGNEASERVLERLGFLRSEVRDGENRWTSHAR